MKSLLVDALRAANDNSDDGLSLEETIAPGLPAARPQEKTECAPEIDAGLELRDSVDAATDVEVAGNDAQFQDVETLPELSIADRRVAPAVATAALFERTAKWMPAVCMLLVACSAAAFSGWSSATGVSNNTLLGTQPGTTSASPLDNAPAVDTDKTRFKFIESSSASAQRTGLAARTASTTAGSQPAATSVVRISQARAPQSVAGLTDADGASFSSITVIYQAYVSGQINQAALDRLLERAVTNGGESVELEIKLLLQRHPDSVSLHNALGTALANNARWPEARVAYERAVELAQSASGRALQ